MVAIRLIRVIVVDDHDGVQAALTSFLDTWEDFEFVGKASSGLDALVLCEHVKPDVVLMDVSLLGMNGIDTTRLLCQRHPQIKVIGVTGHDTPQVISEMREAGAVDCFCKDGLENETLAEAIRDAMAKTEVYGKATRYASRDACYAVASR